MPLFRRSHDSKIAMGILERLPVGVIVLDTQQRVICWNEWIAKAAQMHAQNAVGKCLLDVFPEVRNTRLYTAVCDALQKGHPALLSSSLHQSPLPLYRDPTAFHGQGSDGARINQAIQILAITLPNYPRAYVIQISDVTQIRMREDYIRKQANDLRELQQRRQALLHSIPDIAWLKDIEGRYIAVNERFAQVHGVAVDAVAGENRCGNSSTFIKRKQHGQPRFTKWRNPAL